LTPPSRRPPTRDGARRQWTWPASSAAADLVAVRTKEANALADLNVERARVDGERKAVEADLGPVRYLSALLGATDETTMRWFILVVALLLDPAAVLLLAATHRQYR